MTTQLTTLQRSEREVLERNEAVIRDGLNNFMKVGKALLEIREFKLYRETHATFEAYLKEKWSLSYRRAIQLIDASVVVENMNNCSGLAVENEAQARELSTLPPEQQAPAFQAAQEAAKTEGRDVTAKDVKAAVKARKPQPAPEIQAEPIQPTEKPTEQPNNDERIMHSLKVQIEEMDSLITNIRDLFNSLQDVPNRQSARVTIKAVIAKLNAIAQ